MNKRIYNKNYPLGFEGSGTQINVNVNCKTHFRYYEPDLSKAIISGSFVFSLWCKFCCNLVSCLCSCGGFFVSDLCLLFRLVDFAVYIALLFT